MLYTLIIQAGVLGTGLLGWLTVAHWLAVGLAVSVLLAVVWARRGRLLRAEWRLVAHRVARTRRAAGPWGALLAIVWMLAAAWLFVLAWWVGPHVGDVVGYHLMPPTDWLAEGTIRAKDWPDARGWWPQNEGLVSMAWMLPLSSIRGSVAAQSHWLALLAAAVWALTRRWGASPREASLATTLAVTTPIALAQHAGVMNDIIIAALMIAAWAFLASPHVRLFHLLFAVLAGVMALGVKPTVLAAGPGLALLFLFRAAQRWRQRRGSPSGARDRARGAEWPTTGLAVFVLVLGVVLTGYWLARNANVWGEPMYPWKLGLAKHLGYTAADDAGENSDGGNSAFAGSMSHTQPATLAKAWTNLRDMATNKLWDRHLIPDGQGTGGSGFGPVAAAMGLPALLALLFALPRARPVLLAVLLTVPLTAAGIDHDPWKGRFFCYLACIAAACAGIVTFRLPGDRAGTWRWLRALWGFMLVTAWVGSLFIGLRATWPRTVSIAERVMRQVPAADLSPASFRYLHQAMAKVDASPSGRGGQPSGSAVGALDSFDRFPRRPRQVMVVLVFTDRGVGPFALLHGPGMRRALLYHEGLPDREFVAAWRRAGIAWVCVVAEPDRRVGIRSALEARGLRRAQEGLYVIE